MVPSAKVCLDSRERVFALITAMAGMVESAVDESIEAILANNTQLARALLQRESLINRMEMHIDAAILFHLGQSNLGDDDIRSMASLLKINKDLERIGDLAANIGRKVLEMSGQNEDCQRSELQPMAIAVSHICRKTLRALVRRDVILAESALGSEAFVHAYRDYVFRRIRERLGAKPAEAAAEADLALLLASRYLEQIADHAANLADSLFFWMCPQPQGEQVA